jgi:hypothetical protein
MSGQQNETVPRREWVACFLSCVFDLDAGQTVESCYPEGVLTLGESKIIAYGAFPVRPSTPAGGALRTSVTLLSPYHGKPVVQESLTQSSAVRNGVSDRLVLFALLPL